MNGTVNLTERHVEALWQRVKPSGVSRREFLGLLGKGGVAAGLASLPLHPLIVQGAPAPRPITGQVPGKPRDEIIYSSATGLARAIRTKEISSEELVKAYLQRITEVNPKLNAVVQLAENAALAQARAADRALARGNITWPLHGVPMTIKDSIDTAGVISTGGTRGRASFVPAEDATVVARMRAAGAILLGKTNTPELTLWAETNNPVYGRTNNPYDLSRTPGGSSGGAGAIIAAGGPPLDLGSDTGGSVRIPSHCCGITGLKPTSGRVPRTGHIIPFAMGAADPLTTIGPMARYVEDLILTLPIISGVDWRDPEIIPMPLRDPRDVDLKRLRVAFYTDNGILSPTPETVAVVRTAVKKLSDAVLSVEENRPAAIKQAHEVRRLRESEPDGGAWVKRRLKLAGTTKPGPILQRNLDRVAEEVMSTAEYGALLENLGVVRSRMISFMKNYDVIICPALAYPAWPHGALVDAKRGWNYTATYNQTGWPAAVVRGGTSPEGLPIGVQIVARPWREDVVLAVAQHLEIVLGGWQRPQL